jgi:hypothetical protein
LSSSIKWEQKGEIFSGQLNLVQSYIDLVRKYNVQATPFECLEGATLFFTYTALNPEEMKRNEFFFPKGNATFF